MSTLAYQAATVKHRFGMGSFRQAIDGNIIRMLPVSMPPRGSITLSLAMLVLVNLVPLLGVLFLGWNVFEIMMLFWMENIVIGALNLARMASVMVMRREPGLLVMIPFFLFHYGAFTTGHGIFLIAMFGDTHMNTGGGLSPFFAIEIAERAIAIQPGLYWAIIGIAASHLLSFAINFLGRREYARADLGVLMFGPYTRIVIMHVTILMGGIAIVALGKPVYALVVLIVLKTIIDAWQHLGERNRLAETLVP